MDIRTDRVGVLVDQLTQSAELSKGRFDDLGDAEYLWEPVSRMWSIRRRTEATTPEAFGPGEWVLDGERRDPFAPGPMTTIAWRIGHLLSMFAGRWEWTFGPRTADPDTLVDFTPVAGDALADLWGWADKWAARIDGLTDDELDIPGFGQYPHGLDPQLPFIGILWWMNREFIHHLAEVALLRDLYAHRSSWSGSATP
jgi:hypothetical protein